MSFSFAGAFAAALSAWRGARDLLVPVAGVFFFLPALALALFLPQLDSAGLEGEALGDALLAWYGSVIHWFALQLLVQLFGSAVVLVLMLDPDRPTLGEAMARALRLLLRLVLGSLAATLLIVAGLLLFILPGLYAAGRAFLVLPTLVAERDRGVADGLDSAFRHTRGHAWLLLLLALTVVLGNFVMGNFAAAVEVGAGALGTLASAIVIAAVSAVTGLAQALLQVAAYRALALDKRGT